MSDEDQKIMDLAKIAFEKDKNLLKDIQNLGTEIVYMSIFFTAYKLGEKK